MRVDKTGGANSLGQWLTVDGCSHGIMWRCKRHIRSRKLLRELMLKFDRFGAPYLGKRY